MTKMYECSMCGYIGECRSEEDALSELKADFGDVDPKDCDVVCDDCWQMIKPGNHPGPFIAWGKERED